LSIDSTMRLIIDAPATGSWNMAVDQAVLETADETGQPTLRFYQWSEPTLSLGYFQSVHDRGQHPASQRCPLVRRASGGGAIVHDREITYSLCLPSINRWSEANEAVYALVHQAVVEILAEQKITAHRFVENAGADETAPWHRLEENSLVRQDSEQSQQPISLPRRSIRPPKPFLCFQRHHPGDVLIGENKLLGSAQRRRRNAMLQHGSLLWQRSPFAPELPGLTDLAFDLALSSTSSTDLIGLLASRIESVLKCEATVGTLSSEEFAAAEVIEQTQFGNADWTNRR